MLEVFDEARLAAAGPRTLSDLLEQGNIVYFPRCPVPLPPEADLEALRNTLPGELTRKNASYHPEADVVTGISRNSAIYPVAHRTLSSVRQNIAGFTRRVMPERAFSFEPGYLRLLHPLAQRSAHGGTWPVSDAAAQGHVGFGYSPGPRLCSREYFVDLKVLNCRVILSDF